MRTLRYSVVLLVLTRLAAAAPLTLENRVVKHVCPNGIKLLVLERHFSPTVSVRMMFRTGSVDEVSGKTGLAHMFEHMMFKGTRTLGTKNYALEAPLLVQIDALHRQLDREKAKGDKADQTRIGKLIDQLTAVEQKENALVKENELWDLYEREGASDLNAGTAPDFTQYVVDLPSNKIKLWAILDSDRVKNPVFRQFYQEREVVKEERRMRVDTNPEGKLYENFIASAFTAHSYRHPTIGWESDLDHLSVADLTNFYHHHYTPDHLTIAIVGDVKAQDMIALVDQYFGNWVPASPSAGDVETREPPQQGVRRVQVETEAEPRLLMGYHIAAYPNPDHNVYFAISYLLGTGRSSRLYKYLVQKKHLATAIEADQGDPGERYDSLFIITAAPRYPHTPNDVEQGVWTVLNELKEHPIEPWELEKVRSGVAVNLLQTLQTNAGMASTLAYDESIFGDWRYLIHFQKEIENISADDIQRVAKKIFTPENETFAFLVKKERKGSIPMMHPQRYR